MALLGDFSKLAQAISALNTLASPTTFRAIAKNIGEELVTLVDDGFESESTPSGAKWAPLKKPSRRRRGGKILQDRGKLRSSIHYRLQGDEVLVGTKLFYATFHQSGTSGRSAPETRNQPIDKRGRFAAKKKALARKAGSVAFRELAFKQGSGGIPRRQFLPDDDAPLPGKWDTRIADVIMDELRRHTRSVA